MLDFLRVNLIDILGMSTTFLTIPTILFIDIIIIKGAYYLLENVTIDIIFATSKNKIKTHKSLPLFQQI